MRDSFQPLFHFRVHGVAQAVAQHVNGDDGDKMAIPGGIHSQGRR